MFTTFNAYAVTDQKFGKRVAPVVRRGLQEWPVADVTATIEVGPDRSRMTITRIAAGGALLGPAGLILGGLARKDVTRGVLHLDLAGETARVEFPGKQLERAMAFVEALDSARQGVAS